MEKESTSFWADIKKYEDILAKDPRSYCFAPLSELYRKLGLLDDAIGVALRGTEVHPEYVGGYMALGRAYYEKGQREKSKEALERVAKATPENFLAQKTLFQIYNDEGNTSSAERALQLLVGFYPEDVESRLILESMRKSAASRDELVSEPVLVGEPSGEAERNKLQAEQLFEESLLTPGPVIFAGVDSNEVIDSGESLLSLDMEDEEVEGSESSDTFRPSPLPTLTLAELYASQGFQRQALGVYEELLREEPENTVLLERVDILRRCLDDNEKSMAPFPGDSGSCYSGTSGAELYYRETMECFEKEASREQMILEKMEDWLNSIRRLRECR
jgi:tetratricopeptide (TPR) repeat protein